MMARITALVDDCSTVVMRLSITDQDAEVGTSRALALHGIARLTRHSNPTKVEVTSTHSKATLVTRMLNTVSGFLCHIRTTAEQLAGQDRWRLILNTAFQFFLRGKGLGTHRLIPDASC